MYASFCKFGVHSFLFSVLSTVQLRGTWKPNQLEAVHFLKGLLHYLRYFRIILMILKRIQFYCSLIICIFFNVFTPAMVAEKIKRTIESAQERWSAKNLKSEMLHLHSMEVLNVVDPDLSYSLLFILYNPV